MCNLSQGIKEDGMAEIFAAHEQKRIFTGADCRDDRYRRKRSKGTPAKNKIEI